MGGTILHQISQRRSRTTEAGANQLQNQMMYELYFLLSRVLVKKSSTSIRPVPAETPQLRGHNQRMAKVRHDTDASLRS